jgi:hypothetical protein
LNTCGCTLPSASTRSSTSCSRSSMRRNSRVGRTGPRRGSCSESNPLTTWAVRSPAVGDSSRPRPSFHS